MIPSRPPPRLTEETRWSAKFRDFLSRCLTKNPAERPTASDLLKDPFTQEGGNKSKLGEIVAEALDRIANGALNEDLDEGAGSTMKTGLQTMELNDATMKQAPPKRNDFDSRTATIRPHNTDSKPLTDSDFDLSGGEDGRGSDNHGMTMITNESRAGTMVVNASRDGTMNPAEVTPAEDNTPKNSEFHYFISINFFYY